MNFIEYHRFKDIIEKLEKSRFALTSSDNNGFIIKFKIGQAPEGYTETARIGYVHTLEEAVAFCEGYEARCYYTEIMANM